ncbi:MAG: hypothetical protein C5B56_06620 [Proteobacteria bacterium]|nr:MAG: hypothetical protein C5B56_06620 [Pseudomonadota bacterium]
MIVHRSQCRRVRTRELLRRIASASGFERRMELGELEAGVADALCASQEDDLPVLRALRRGHWTGLELPPEVEVSTPEGFATRATDPDLYRMAAARFAAELRPDRVAVIGIRGAGTTLSSVVEEELRRRGISAESSTVRPRGNGERRELRVSDSLAAAWRAWAGWFALVGDGPGASGASFASAAEFLAGLGVADERIVLFPGRETDGSDLTSECARRRWQRHRRYVSHFEELALFAGAQDLSDGAWRNVRGIWPAVHPRHERRKYCLGDRLYKFAGYGRYGREKLERSRRLHPFTPAATGLTHGFLETAWVEGRPAGASVAFLEHAARYLTFLRREFHTGQMANAKALAEMIAVNTGREWPGPLPEAPAVAMDGRMLPQEWIETRNGFVKTDALDHGDDRFLPGPQDIAWDLAACAVEFGGGEYLLERYRRESGDRGVAARLPFYRTAWLAFRLGYAELAVRQLGDSEDGERFRRERARYAAALESEEPWTTTRNRLSASIWTAC